MTSAYKSFSALHVTTKLTRSCTLLTISMLPPVISPSMISFDPNLNKNSECTITWGSTEENNSCILIASLTPYTLYMDNTVRMLKIKKEDMLKELKVSTEQPAVNGFH